MLTADFDFILPPECIAAHPARPRDAARLLRVGLGVGPEGCADHRVRDLPALLRAGDLLVCNDTRVIPARLRGERPRPGVSGGSGEPVRVEATLHKRQGPGVWRVFARPGKRLRPGDTVVFADDLTARVVLKTATGEVELDFGCGDAALLEALHRVGEMPLPPYIPRAGGAEATDAGDYQTVFAARDGAVAAPTAGLHFTPELLAALAEAGIGRAAVTLHVGAGTFLPVKVDDPREHAMHAEYGEVSPATVAAIAETRRRGGRVVAVGTTALRILESASTPDGTLHPFAGETSIFILPGYRFRQPDVLLTNFHLPRSTLFMLVSAFAGLERMQTAYAHAIASGYRFYSYGDACLLERDDG